MKIILIFLISINTILSHDNLLSLQYITTYLQNSNKTYYFDEELEPVILSDIVLFLTKQSEYNLFNAYVLQNGQCALVFQTYKNDIKELTTNYFGSGLTFESLGLEEECYEQNKNFLYLTYNPSNETASLSGQIYHFLEKKNKSIGLCLDANCATYYKEMLNMHKNKLFNQYLTAQQNVSNLVLQKSLFNTSQLMDEIINQYNFKALTALLWVIVTCILIRILFTLIGYVIVNSADEEELPDVDFDVKSISRGDLGDLALEASEGMLFPTKQKKKGTLVDFIISLNLIDSFRKLFQLHNTIYNEKDIVLVSGIRMLMLIFVIVAQNTCYMVKQPHKSSALVNLFRRNSFIFLKFSIYAFEGIKILNGVLLGYKLVSYLRKVHHKGEIISIKHMFKFYMKSIVYVLSFIFIFFCIQQLFLEMGMKIKPSSHYEFFSKELNENIECLNKPWTIFIPFYLQYFSSQIGITNQTCFKTAFFTLSEFYCFTFIIIITYIFIKLKAKLIEMSLFIVNMLLIFFAYFISIESKTILGEKLKFSIIDGPSETLALPHMFFLFYYVGFNIGIMFYFWVNLENIYTEYNDILTNKKTNLYLPFEYNLHLMKLFSKPTQWIKSVLAVVFGLLLLLAPFVCYKRLKYSQKDNFVPKINIVDTLFYVYEPVFYSLMFSFFVIFIMMSDRRSFIPNFFRSKLFNGINRIFFAGFNLFNFITQLFHGLYNVDMYLNVMNIIECSFTIMFQTLIVGIAYVIMVEFVLRVAFKMICGEEEKKKKISGMIKQEELLPDDSY